MKRSWQQLRADALAVWQAGVRAVDSRLLVRNQVQVVADGLQVGRHVFPVLPGSRCVVVGGGKAAAGMAQGLLDALGDEFCQRVQLTGWLNVPDHTVRDLPWIHLHGARPAGMNEPTQQGVAGTEHILQLVAELTPNDGCICLLSGGASALLPAPVPEVPLEEKLLLTRFLSSAGANIQQLNTVRKHLSRIKGGGLARRCRGGWLLTLIISDVLGDPLDVIGSGPTVPDTSTPADALRILDEFGATDMAPHAVAYLHQNVHQTSAPAPSTRVVNIVIGNNATAVEAAAAEAAQRGYRCTSQSASQPEGPAEEIGQQLAHTALSMQHGNTPRALISGGEPVVRLAPEPVRGRGGRNQQLVLAAFCYLLASVPDRHSTTARYPHVNHDATTNPCRGLILLSGGTDGEDGPTEAAGAWIDEQVYQEWLRTGLNPSDYLARNDAFTFFQAVGGLLVTGPTDTNVCDLRIVLTT